MSRVVFLSLTLALTLTNSPVSSKTLFIAIGNDSCATAFRPENRLQSAAWILGFWSARNLEKKAEVGATSDANGIVAEVELACSKLPSSKMKIATIFVYDVMENEGR
jgi:hypothetical protein